MGNATNESTLRTLCDTIRERALWETETSVSNDNVFSILEVIDKEVPYCRVLAYLIREYWPTFERDVLEGCCNGEKLKHIDREYFCSAPCATYNREGRIDILLETERHVVAIEVKVGAEEQADQLIRYAKTLQKDFPSKDKRIYFLTVDGHAPQTEKCTQPCAEKCETKAVSISFNNHICRWLKSVADGEMPNVVATQFLEVLKVGRKSVEQTKELLDILRQSEEYPKAVRLLSRVLPDLWEEIRTTFLEEVTTELCNRHKFQRTERNRPYKNEIWAERLRRGDKELCLCYETNFFIRTGEQNKQWRYISKAAFHGSEGDQGFYCSTQKSDAFCLTGFSDSNDELVGWFYDRDRYPTAVQNIANSANRFFEEANPVESKAVKG